MIDDVAERERLIIDHLPLLKHIVGRMCFDTPGSMERDDLFGFGMIGLLAAADSWDATRGLAFSTYAYPRIRGAILDELRRCDFLPRGRRELVREIEGVIERLEQENGQKPAPEEIAAALGRPTEDIDEALLSAATAVQTSLEGGPGEELAAMLVDPRCDDPVGSVEWEELKGLLIEAIEDLPQQEKTVITLYYAEELLLREIAEVLGVTESRVSQIHTRAVYRLNRALTALTGGSSGTGTTNHGRENP
jgi:RNA polymerase sigma factor for flagellar operon FliA